MKKLIFCLFLFTIVLLSCFSSAAADNGDIIYFGSYPQSMVTDPSVTGALSECDLQWKSFDFYSGTGEFYDGKMEASNICEYADVTYMGKRYRAVRINEYRPFATCDPAEDVYSYQPDNGFEDGQIYWFEYEPVQWTIIDKNSNLVMSKYVIDSQSFNNVIFSDDDESFYTSESKKEKADNYSTSSLASFLRTSFSSTAFTNEEKKILDEQPSIVGKSIYDKLEETLRSAEATAYAKIMGLFLSDEKPCWWINNNESGAWISNGLGNSQNLFQEVNFSGIGLRPALTMSEISCNHKYITTTVKATFTSDGKTEQKCTACGYINKKTSIKKVSDVTLSKTSLVYTGQIQKPVLTVKDSGGKALPASSYTVTWSSSSPKAVGKYTVTVKLKGNYSGSKSLSFKIVPGKATNLAVTSAKYGKVSVSWDAAPGASVYQIYVSTSASGTYSLNKETKSKSATISNLSPGKKYYIKVRGYKTVSDVNYTGSFTSAKSVTVNDGSIAVKNGKLYAEKGISYIQDTSTGVKFIIVNKTYSLPSDYAPGGLTKECSTAFSKLVAAAKKDGITITNVSGYRSYSYQTSLYNKYVNRDGKAKADTYSARPGHSEHQTGLAIDCNSVKSSFANTKEGKWLAAHCTEYGFIIRFGASKESSTGYQYEPWHIRYLGSSTLAKKIANSGKSIEEYYGITSKYS